MDVARVAELLVRAGLSASKPDKVDAGLTLRKVEGRLKDEFRLDQPHTAPRLGGLTSFAEVEVKTIGGRQYVLEKGRPLGKYWRIRERGSPMQTRFFVWERFSEEHARELWSSFTALLELRLLLAHSDTDEH